MDNNFWKRWRPWEVQLLRETWPSPHLTTREILEDLHRTSRAVHTKASQLGINRPCRGPKLSVSCLAQRNTNGESYLKLARELNLTVGQIAGLLYRYRETHGITPSAPKRDYFRVPIRHNRQEPSMPRFKCLEAADGSL